MVNFTCLQNIKIMVGTGCHQQIGEALREAVYKKAFIVDDSGVKSADIVDQIIASIEGTRCTESGCDCVIGMILGVAYTGYETPVEIGRKSSRNVDKPHRLLFVVCS